MSRKWGTGHLVRLEILLQLLFKNTIFNHHVHDGDYGNLFIIYPENFGDVYY